jgi:hypothetical protein
MQKLSAGEWSSEKISGSTRRAFVQVSLVSLLRSAPKRFHLFTIQAVRMKILGIELSKPSFNEVTGSAVMAAGLWLVCVALFKVSDQPMDRVEAGAALLMIFWGCVGVRMGIRFDRGLRHLAANVVCGGAILLAYHGIVTLLG